MGDGTFNKIAQSVILRVGNSIIANHGELTWRHDWQNCLRPSYESARQAVHDEMRKFPPVPDHRIDRHKVAAAYTKAIMVSKPLEIKGGTLNPSVGARLANEALAFLSAVRVVQSFLVARFESEPVWATKIRDTSIRFPPAHDGFYPEHAYKAFRNATLEQYNFFVLANLYFLIESYHLQSLGWIARVPNLADQL
ncbi:MAG: hypothetical protein Q7J38_04040 [Gallionella sp.]|nr:hypothetical protein [Gallionella sp.]